MNRMTAPTLFVTLLLPMAALAGPGNVCGDGRLLDVQMDTQMINGGTSEHGQVKVKKNGKQEYNSNSTSYPYKQTIYTVTVRLEDMVYTAQSENIFGLGFKPTAYIVNDPVRACLRGDTLALERPDGKEYKARVVRTARVIPADAAPRY